MIDRRIVAHMAAGLAMAAFTGCQQQGDAGSNQAAPAPRGRTVFGAPAPTPSPTPPPQVTPSPRSIMQPDVIEKPIVPPPLMPVAATIGFPDGGSRLDAAARQQLDALIANPVTASGGPIVLRGSSDSRGSDADNKAASKRRAQAVATYLEQHGIAGDRLTLVALGEDRPVAPNANLDGSDNPEGRARNRRVDITIQPGDEAAPADAATSPSNESDAAASDQRQSPRL